AHQPHMVSRCRESPLPPHLHREGMEMWQILGPLLPPPRIEVAETLRQGAAHPLGPGVLLVPGETEPPALRRLHHTVAPGVDLTVPRVLEHGVECWHRQNRP